MWLLSACVLSHLQEQPPCSSLPGFHQPGGRPGPSLERQSFLQLHITPAALSGVTLLLLLYTSLEKLPCTQQDWPRAGRWLSSKAPRTLYSSLCGKCLLHPPRGAAERVWGICYSLGNSVSWVHHRCEISPNFQTWSCTGFPAIYSNISQTLPLPADRKFPKHEEGKELKGQEKRFPKLLQVSKDSHRSPCPFSNVSRKATDGNTFIYNEVA